MSKCIYCLRELSSDKFNREHVIPEAFGKFENNIVLHKIVCKDCNQYFGDNLELILGRGSLEALLRIEEGLNSPERSKAYKKERIALRVSSADHLNGLHVWFGDLGIVPMPQVRFRSKDRDGFIFVKSLDLEDPNYEIPDDVDMSDLAILANSKETKLEIIDALAGKGISFIENYEEGVADRGGEIAEIEITTVVDNLVFRAIAKITFNYLANISGSSFAISSQFNEIRDYIRYGDLPEQSMVSVIRDPILFYDKPNMRQTNGHLIALDWDYRSYIINCKLSLFNNATYQVVLSRNCSGLIFRNINSGHHFDFGTQQVKKLSFIRTL